MTTIQNEIQSSYMVLGEDVGVFTPFDCGHNPLTSAWQLHPPVFVVNGSSPLEELQLSVHCAEESVVHYSRQLAIVVLLPSLKQ